MTQTYEFENIVNAIDLVERVTPYRRNRFMFKKRIALRIGKNYKVALNPGVSEIKLNKYYDLFFAVCQFPSELLMVNAVKGWKDYCKKSVCFLSELWLKEMPHYKASLRILAKFDYVFTNCSQSVSQINEIIGGKCFYLPPATDAILFSPFPQRPRRVVDVLSIGRRAEVTHKELLRMAREDKIFYIFDSLNSYHVLNIEEHRYWLANMAKRSRYFIVNPGKIDVPDEIGDQSEIGFRYFEAAASGSLLIGESPDNEEFRKIFFWPDAVLHVPYNSDSINDVIKEIDNRPERQREIRKNNLIQSLLKHDWVYRWETILKISGLEPQHELVERKRTLMNLHEMVKKECE